MILAAAAVPDSRGVISGVMNSLSCLFIMKRVVPALLAGAWSVLIKCMLGSHPLSRGRYHNRRIKGDASVKKR
jgi:hypothetical protein